ncbi:hypothetical protein [Alteribacillus bidgolensis]|uniref:Sulfotransferase family protein n=1 Tax=Alteribacillus bidgolensis TaxID=930129 RepID=A0A1G8I393_9BACI|nr:hypothetical protein [Alteribacillus bidgolensis]SDI13314.1 hypothetical protein SAMN05216352_10520 [Alteribacillus bidgolensis]
MGNKINNPADKLAIFMHIPKTAGTTLLHLFKKNYIEKERRVYP